MAKLVVEKLAKSRIEKYKNDLQRQSDEFRHELNKITITHKIKYAKLYEEKGQVIQKFHKLLLALEYFLSRFTKAILMNIGRLKMNAWPGFSTEQNLPN